VQAAQVAQDLRTRLAPVVEAAGYDLEDLVVTPAGKRRLVRLVVDKDGGVTLDECAELSRQVSPALDEADEALGQGAYTLEVSSPGVARPLTAPRHWRRSLGRLVRVTRTEGAAVTGRLVAVDDEGVELEVDGARLTIALAQVAKAVVQVELSRQTPADGQG
jgi:ribosome maturation factor RimP